MGDRMGQCIIIKNRWSSFKAYIDVIATPGSTVTATIGTTVYTDTAAANTGIVHFTVKKRGTYTITSNATNTQTVTINVDVLNEVYSVIIVGKFTLTLSNATGTTLSANRTSSGLGNGSTGVLTNGAVIYYGDVITFTAGNANSTVYNNPTLKVNSANFTSGGSHTVTGNVTAQTTTSVKSFTITISKGANTSLSLKKTSSPYANNGVNSTYTANFTAYYGDKFTVTASASTNYNLSSLKWGSTSISSGSTQTATGAITVSSAASVILKTFYFYGYSSSSFKPTWTFNYPATMSTFIQVANDATYRKATNTATSGNFTYYGFVVPMNNSAKHIGVKTTTQNSPTGSGTVNPVYNKSGTIQLETSTIVANYQYAYDKTYAKQL